MLSRTTKLSWYLKKHSPSHTYPDHQLSFICLLHLLWSTASSLFNLRAWQSFLHNLYLEVFFGIPFSLAHSTSYSTHFFTQSLSSFSTTCSYHHNLFCCTVVPRLYHVIPFSLSTLYLELSLLPQCHISIWPFSSLPATVPPHFLFLQARSHFHATYYFAHNCCTISVSLSIIFLISKQCNQVLEFIPSHLNSGLHSCITISVYTQHVT